MGVGEISYWAGQEWEYTKVENQGWNVQGEDYVEGTGGRKAWGNWNTEKWKEGRVKKETQYFKDKMIRVPVEPLTFGLGSRRDLKVVASIPSAVFLLSP